MQTKKINISLLTRLTMLSAIIIIMAFTPFGYLRIGVIEVTFLQIPVAVGAILLGPGAGAFLGGVFGATSFIQCFGISAFGTALFAINPVFTFILCLIPRIAMGWLSGLVFAALKGIDKTKLISYIGASFSAPALNTVFFIAGLMLLFGNTEFILGIRGGAALLNFLAAFIGVNGVIEVIACTLISSAICKSIYYIKLGSNVPKI